MTTCSFEGCSLRPLHEDDEDGLCREHLVALLPDRELSLKDFISIDELADIVAQGRDHFAETSEFLDVIATDGSISAEEAGPS